MAQTRGLHQNIPQAAAWATESEPPNSQFSHQSTSATPQTPAPRVFFLSPSPHLHPPHLLQILAADQNNHSKAALQRADQESSPFIFMAKGF